MPPILDKDGKEILKIAICVPCGETVQSLFAYDLARLVGYMNATHPEIEIQMLFSQTSILPQQRMYCARSAIKWGATHVLFIDSDMRFPFNALDRLLDRKLPIVACNYTTRKMPYSPTAAQDNNQYVYTTEESTGTEEVWRCGFGFCLISADVFRAMPEPWFFFAYTTQGNDFIGEDVMFFVRAREKGFALVIDHDLSKEIRHLGQTTVTLEHAIACRELDKPTVNAA